MDEYVEVGVLIVLFITVLTIQEMTPRKLDKDRLSLPALAGGLLLCGLAVGMSLAATHGVIRGPWVQLVQRGLLLVAMACSAVAGLRLGFARPG